MALVKCKECGQEVSQKAGSCPKCGAPIKKKTSVVTWLVTGLLALWFIGILSSKNEKLSSSPVPAPTSSSKNAPATFTDSPKEIYKITAQQLFADYGANEVATDEKIKGKIVQVGGTVESINKDFTDSIIVSLRTSNQFMSARMYVNDSEKQRAIVLKKGDRVVLQCKKMTRGMGSPVGSDCEFIQSKIKIK